MTRIADTIAATLHAHGIRHAFGMPGGEVVTLIDGLERAGIRFVLARNETAAAMHGGRRPSPDRGARPAGGDARSGARQCGQRHRRRERRNMPRSSSSPASSTGRPARPLHAPDPRPRRPAAPAGQGQLRDRTGKGGPIAARALALALARADGAGASRPLASRGRERQRRRWRPRRWCCARLIRPGRDGPGDRRSAAPAGARPSGPCSWPATRRRATMPPAR
jgi:hypothetical protein